MSRRSQSALDASLVETLRALGEPGVFYAPIPNPRSQCGKFPLPLPARDVWGDQVPRRHCSPINLRDLLGGVPCAYQGACPRKCPFCDTVLWQRQWASVRGDTSRIDELNNAVGALTWVSGGMRWTPEYWLTSGTVGLWRLPKLPAYIEPHRTWILVAHRRGYRRRDGSPGPAVTGTFLLGGLFYRPRSTDSGRRVDYLRRRGITIV